MDIKEINERRSSGDWSVSLSGVKLPNPIIPASGCFGFGYNMADYYDLNLLGAISLKGTTLNPRIGNPLPRVAECTSGLINSVGLQNPGIDALISTEIPKLRKIYHNPIVANISGFSVDEYAECCRRADKCADIDIIELNVSCPNVHGGGMSFGTDPKAAAEVVSAVRAATSKPVYVKLTPNVTDIVAIAKAVADAGADGLCLINTLLGMRIDTRTGQPVVANVMGGFSGPAVLPVAIRMVWQVSHAVDLPIIGCGGVATANDAIEMMLAGATAVEVGSANLVDPFACPRIIEGLSKRP